MGANTRRLLVRRASPYPSCGGLPQPPALKDMLLRHDEVQYVCRYAARQSHGRPIHRPQPPSLALSGRLKRSRKRNDI